ncbi:hypothetical protein [Kushneria sp. EE4]
MTDQEQKLVKQMRFLVGDTDTESPLIPDDTYLYLFDQYGSVQVAAAEALESLINELSLSPKREKAGGYEVERHDIDTLERRLTSLKRKRNRVAPMIVHSDRESWDDFDSIFASNHRRPYGQV